MDTLINALKGAIELISSSNPQLLEIVGLTLQVAGTGLLVAILIGLPLGVWIGLSRRIPGAGWLMPLIYTGMGFPPVVVGLFVYLLLSNSGPFGNLQWLFSPMAMISAQAIIGLPLVLGLTIAALQSLEPKLQLQLRSLGATKWQLAWTMLAEARFGIFAAIVAAFGSIISEVGAVMLVGGNIAGETRVLTTAIVLETGKGNFSLAIALGLILLGIAFVTNIAFFSFQRNGINK
jgi:tungstate transport system permease protein